MPVFISHRTADDTIAQNVAWRLKSLHEIQCYVDNFDREADAARSTRNITSLILRRLDMCTHLLAIVTRNTEGSWWVPFEIGVARKAPRAIATLTNLGLGLPQYLEEWPVLRGEDAIDKFAAIYKRHRIDARRTLLEKVASVADQDRLVGSFHTELKRALAQ